MVTVLLFAKAVVKHWTALITGGIVIALLTLWQDTGHPVAYWVYWSVAVIALVIAFYRAWLDEHRNALRLAEELDRESAKQQEAARQQQETIKKDLLRALTTLRTIEPEVVNWADVSLDKYGMNAAACAELATG